MKRVILASGSPRRQELLARTGLKFEVIPGNIDEAAVTAAQEKPAGCIETPVQEDSAGGASQAGSAAGNMSVQGEASGNGAEGASQERLAAGNVSVRRETSGDNADGASQAGAAAGNAPVQGKFSGNSTGNFAQEVPESVRPYPARVVEALSAAKAESVAAGIKEGVVIGADTVVWDGAILGKPKDRADARAMLRALQGRTHSVFTGVTVLVKEAADTDADLYAENEFVAVAAAGQADGEREAAAADSQAGRESEAAAADDRAGGISEAADSRTCGKSESAATDSQAGRESEAVAADDRAGGISEAADSRTCGKSEAAATAGQADRESEAAADDRAGGISEAEASRACGKSEAAASQSDGKDEAAAGRASEESVEADVCRHAGKTGKDGLIRHTFSCETRVHVYPMTEQETEQYLDAGEYADKAGAYGIQGKFGMWVQGVEGDYNNVVGLPLSALWQILKQYV